MQEHIGRIIHLDRDNKFGLLKSEIDSDNYYFKTIVLHGDIQLNDRVTFTIRNKDEKQVITIIRRIYQNKYGMIFIPRVNSSHIHKGVEPYFPYIFEQITKFDEEKIVMAFEFPSIVGKTTCVTTNENDEIFYAIRVGRSGHTRFVLNREPFNCNFITVVLLRVPTHYLIMSSYIGNVAKPEPWDEHASPDDLEFWKEHALIFGEEKIIDDSQSKTCPWVLNMPAICKINGHENKRINEIY
jgi:hypothetical protein